MNARHVSFFLTPEAQADMEKFVVALILAGAAGKQLCALQGGRVRVGDDEYDTPDAAIEALEWARPIARARVEAECAL